MEFSSVEKVSCWYSSNKISKELFVKNEKIKQNIEYFQTFGSNPKLREDGCSTKISAEIKEYRDKKLYKIFH
jgi:hypothetical protein